MDLSLFQAVYALIRQVPSGHVATYGQLGRIAGCSARTVGFALAALPVGTDVPWQRVINSRGEVSPRRDGGRDQLQRELLEAEGVDFDVQGRVDLSVFGWSFTPADLGGAG